MVLFAVMLLAACNGHTPEDAVSGKPMRIVSLDYCADQYVLKLVDKDRILAVSPDAKKPFSYMRASAEELITVRPFAEDVLILKPDLIVRSYGGGPGANAFFERAGIPVLNVGYASDLEGVRRVMVDMAEGLGEPQRGADVVAQMDARLAAVQTRRKGAETLYLTPSGVTTGPGGLIHEMLMAAGLRNFQTEPGWQALPMERLAYEQPDLIAAAFFDSHGNYTDAWSAMRHPIARTQLRDQPSVPLQGAWTSCGGWFLVDAIEALANGADFDD